MPEREPVKEQSDIEQKRRWAAAIVRAIESFKGDAAVKVLKAS